MRKYAIIYGQRETGIQERAIEELTKILLDYTFEYPICCKYDENAEMTDCRKIYLGTKQNNPYIRKNSSKTLLSEEEYFIKVENNVIMIEGYDDAGVLYGVLDLYNKYIVKFEYTSDDRYWVNFLENDNLPHFEYGSAPSVKERGLWTWGHVVYDYKGYLDNMMRLKMNCVIIWNDFAPLNADEIIKYAHARNIRVIWGFSWLWDTTNNVDLNDLEGYSEQILNKYESEYSKSCGDGVYFQTFTEFGSDNIDGVLISEAAAAFVNKTASLFYEKYPDIKLLFGLHATSVRNHLSFIEAVDPRIRIIWEDCGAFPFAYIPKDVETFDETKKFAVQISKLRGENDLFGVVTKGLVKLDWYEFKHLTGAQCIGVSNKVMKKNRVDRKSRIWRYIQSGWFLNSDKAYEVVQEMCISKKGDLSVFALVEDGMFEENIMYPVALFSEMLWDCNTDIKVLIGEVSLRSYIDFA